MPGELLDSCLQGPTVDLGGRREGMTQLILSGKTV